MPESKEKTQRLSDIAMRIARFKDTPENKLRIALMPEDFREYWAWMPEPKGPELTAYTHEDPEQRAVADLEELYRWEEDKLILTVLPWRMSGLLIALEDYPIKVIINQNNVKTVNVEHLEDDPEYLSEEELHRVYEMIEEYLQELYAIFVNFFGLD